MTTGVEDGSNDLVEIGIISPDSKGSLSRSTTDMVKTIPCRADATPLMQKGSRGAQTIPKGYARGDDLGGLARVESVVLLIYIDSTSRLLPQTQHTIRKLHGYY